MGEGKLLSDITINFLWRVSKIPLGGVKWELGIPSVNNNNDLTRLILFLSQWYWFSPLFKPAHIFVAPAVCKLFICDLIILLLEFKTINFRIIKPQNQINIFKLWIIILNKILKYFLKDKIKI